MDTRTEAELVAAYRGGEEAALAVLIQRFLGPVYRFLYRMTGDGPAAEDLSQEAFVKMWRRLDTFDARKPFKTWLFTIARNTAIDYFRKTKALTFSELDQADTSDFGEAIPDERPSAYALLIQSETTKQLEDALANIPAVSRSIILLHDMEDMTFQEIAGATGEPMNTVKSRYRRALASLRKLFAPEKVGHA